MQSRFKRVIAIIAATAGLSACSSVPIPASTLRTPSATVSMVDSVENSKNSNSVNSDHHLIECNKPNDSNYHDSRCRMVREAVCEALELVRGARACHSFPIRIEKSSIDNAWANSQGIRITTEHLSKDEERAKWNQDQDPSHEPIDSSRLTTAVLRHETGHMLMNHPENIHLIHYFNSQLQAQNFLKELKGSISCENASFRRFFLGPNEQGLLKQFVDLRARTMSSDVQCWILDPDHLDADKEKQLNHLATKFQIAVIDKNRSAVNYQPNEKAADAFALYAGACKGASPDDLIHYLRARMNLYSAHVDEDSSLHPSYENRIRALEVHREAAEEILRGEAPCPFPEKFGPMVKTEFSIPSNKLPKQAKGL